MTKRKMEWAVPIGNIRITTNFVANVFLVYLLGTFWGPMWLLFVLTPVATALYASWQKTFVAAAISSAALLGIYYSRAFIILISLFVNSIARLVMQMKSTGAASKPAAKAVVPATVSTSTQEQKLAA